MKDSTVDFAGRYGPWAVVAGASEGTGRAFARKIAERGIPSVLIARREAPLAAVAEEIRAESGVECVTASIDLSFPDAHDRVIDAVGDKEIGLYVGNAGADPNGSRFLDRDVEVWLELVGRNVMTEIRCCHHFGGLMRDRGRGGVLLVNSGACYGGSSFMAMYSASKAFLLNMGEALWAELRPHGVDVLNLVLTMTDTPAFRALLAEMEQPVPEGLVSPDDVADIGLNRLLHGPVHNFGQDDEVAGYAPASPEQRRERITMIDSVTGMIFGD